jgi:hypothetical protein
LSHALHIVVVVIFFLLIVVEADTELPVKVADVAELSRMAVRVELPHHKHDPIVGV